MQAGGYLARDYARPHVVLTRADIRAIRDARLAVPLDPPANARQAREAASKERAAERRTKYIIEAAFDRAHREAANRQASTLRGMDASSTLAAFTPGGALVENSDDFKKRFGYDLQHDKFHEFARGRTMIDEKDESALLSIGRYDRPYVAFTAADYRAILKARGAMHDAAGKNAPIGAKYIAQHSLYTALRAPYLRAHKKAAARHVAHIDSMDDSTTLAVFKPGGGLVENSENIARNLNIRFDLEAFHTMARQRAERTYGTTGSRAPDSSSGSCW